MKPIFSYLFLFFFTSFFPVTGLLTETANGFFRLSTDKSFQEVMDDVVIAIENNNFRIVNRLNLGAAMREAGNERMPVVKAVVFCSIRFANQLFIMREELIEYCPLKVVIRENTVGKVVVSTVMVQDPGPVAQELNTVLKGIVRYATNQ